MQQAVAEDIPDVLEKGLRRHQRDEKALAVFRGKLDEDFDDPIQAVPQHEDHAGEEGKYEGVEAR
jgi:hypothetical protein